jgi:hypothetical protein
MSTDPGSTHYVGDGCQPAHDPRIDQAPPDVWPHPTYIELERQVEQLRAALKQIKEEGGKVCAEFEVCRHVACQSSVAAWMIADAALAREKANYV